MNLDWKRLGDAVTAARRAAGLSQVDLAGAAGLSRSAVQSIERGRVFSAPQLSHRSIAQVLGWTTDSVAAVLAGGEPTRAQQSAPPASGSQPASPIEDGVDALLDDLTARVKSALLGGQVADATAVPMGDGGSAVIIWKAGEGQELTPDQQRRVEQQWSQLQRAARNILADEEQDDQ